MIDKAKALYKKYEEIILYLIFGVLTTIISVGLYWLLDVGFSHLAEAVENPGLTFSNNGAIHTACIVFKNVIAILFAYVTNRIFVFKSKVKGFRAVIIEMLSFFAARLSTMIFEVVFMFITVNVFSLPTIVMNIIAQFVIVVLNYVLSKLWIFNKKGNPDKTR
ncbi:MAG TPA: GtrA family protein [Candidatus Monoglobus merdigallinarum]|uniref:GtrA family protein n=1 Tax=Candidatus Monoglobus merdigallinarum TaxID=2838698 RepID=A0A9D1PSE4_9FIRM|nr:GtrA family protein [Candidatus Monoglobus merdigallinarum]